MAVFKFTQEGRIAMPSNEEYEKADQETAILAYTHGTMADGGPYYAYAAIKPSKFKEFYAKTVARESMIIGDYGTVVAGGFTEEPPPAVLEKMRTLGFDEHYIDKVTEEAREELKAFVEHQEIERITGIVNMLKKKP